MDPRKYLTKKSGIARTVIDENGKTHIIPSTIGEIELGISKSTFETFSNYFLSSATFLTNHCSQTSYLAFEFGNVPVYLFLHALELKLKAKLFSIDNEGKSEESFGKEYRHDIPKLLKNLEKKGIIWDIDLTSDQKYTIDKVGKNYKNKSYNYADQINPSDNLIIDNLSIKEIVELIMKNMEQTIDNDIHY